MTESYLPPAGPPPPQKPSVPEGWVVQWNEQYKEWFYVNSYTKKSQWEKPTGPVYPPGEEPLDAPPGYTPGSSSVAATATGDSKKSSNPFDTHNTPNNGGSSSSAAAQEAEDARLAAQLQAEEDSRARPSSGSNHSYYSHSNSGSPYPTGQSGYQSPAQGSQDPRTKDKGKGGLFGKLKAKLAAPSSSHGGGYGGHHGYPQQHPQFYGGGGYQQYPPQGYYPQQQMYGRPQRTGGGMGMGGAALGLGAGVLGGALIADAINDNEHDAYMDGYQDGQDNDFGGGDFGGGDF
jgi:hypothetical protein